jgi:hypothetical protein
MVQGPGFATLHGVGALSLDVLPMTGGASQVGQCHPHLSLTIRIVLCGGA